jgi:hypothetical protein
MISWINHTSFACILDPDTTMRTNYDKIQASSNIFIQNIFLCRIVDPLAYLPRNMLLVEIRWQVAMLYCYFIVTSLL